MIQKLDKKEDKTDKINLFSDYWGL